MMPIFLLICVFYWSSAVAKVMFPIHHDTSIIVNLRPPYPTSGDGYFMVDGADEDDWSQSAIVFVGNTACERTTWETNSELKCASVPRGIGFGLDVYVRDGDSVWTNKNAFSYNVPSINDLTPAYGSMNGLKSIQIDGSDFGDFPSHVSIFLGQTACVESKWVESGVLECLSPPASAPGSFGMTVVIGGQAVQLPRAYRFMQPSHSEKSLVGVKEEIENLQEAGVRLAAISTKINRTMEFVANNLKIITNPLTTRNTLEAMHFGSRKINSILLAKSFVNATAPLAIARSSLPATVSAIVNADRNGSSVNSTVPSPALQRPVPPLHEGSTKRPPPVYVVAPATVGVVVDNGGTRVITFHPQPPATSASSDNYYHLLALFGFLGVILLVLLWQICTLCILADKEDTKSYVPLVDLTDVITGGAVASQWERIDEEGAQQRVSTTTQTVLGELEPEQQYQSGRQSENQMQSRSAPGLPRWSWQAMNTLREINISHHHIGSSSLRLATPATSETLEEWWQVREHFRESVRQDQNVDLEEGPFQ